MYTGSRRFSTSVGYRGFTLIELVIIIVILGIIATVAIPRFSDIINSSKINATKQEMDALKKAMVGNPAVVAGGEYIDRGFEGDIGFLPSRLVDLVVKPDSVSAYNRLTRLGWNGPYIDSSGGDYALDAWGNNYIYQPGNRRLVSTGGGADSITVSL
ncbi:MAG: prepilin-type N-terminal cleavage/methylation domain-containing protein [candidate division Zixibacteria bacterium]|nr:prepilin-type N-terminal cleavage/methylation domain-containing protein [candidate division Zixibacteria bacterium]